MKKAVIYCRVSSKKQVEEGNGLTSQEANCRKYAREQGFEVVRVFQDDFTGGGDFWQRPGLTRLLAFLDDQEEEHAVIFDDLKRFARDTLFHLKLRQELSSRNAFPQCPNFRFEDTPEGEFVETIIAATGELERKQNRRQVISRMRARLEAGHWVFSPPIGYVYTKRGGEKRIVIDRRECDAVREALEGYAAGTFSTQVEVARFLALKQCYSRWSRGESYSLNAIRRFLSNEFYTGWCVSRKWNIRVRGQHEPIISEDTHRQIMERLGYDEEKPERKDEREEFALRGHIRCSKCGKGITANWSKGRSKLYPYYRCLTHGCGGSTRAEKMEQLFVERLKDATPTEGILRLFERQLRAAFRNRTELRSERLRDDDARIEKLGKEIDALVDSVSRASMPSVRRIYEEKIADLQVQKETLEVHRGKVPDFALEPVMEKGYEFLKSPSMSWETGGLGQRKVIQQLAFDAPIIYDTELAYRTAEFSLVYRLFEASEGSEYSLVELMAKNINPLFEEMRRWDMVLKSSDLG